MSIAVRLSASLDAARQKATAAETQPSESSAGQVKTMAAGQTEETATEDPNAARHGRAKSHAGSIELVARPLVQSDIGAQAAKQDVLRGYATSQKLIEPA